MDTISIGFSYHKNNLVSNAIKAIENSEYSHVYIRRKSKYGEYVYQASGLAVNFTNIDIFLKDNVIVEEYEFHLPDDKRDDLIAFFIKYAGSKYELSALFKLLAMLLGERVRLKLSFEGKEGEFICSELGAFFCETVLGIPMPQDTNFITPKKLNPIIKQYGKRII